MKRTAALERLRRKPILVIDEFTGEIFGKMAAQLKSAGRDYLCRIQDIWLASPAVQHGLKLLTRNKKDLKEIPGLEWIAFPAL